MDLIIFALSVYWLFHVLTRSDILRRPRAWVASWAPQWVVYIGTCPFCFTFWMAVGHIILALWVTGVLWFLPAFLFAAPVVNMVLDKVMKVLIRVNEPPVITTPTAETVRQMVLKAIENERMRGGSLVVGTAAASIPIGTMVSISPRSVGDPIMYINPLDHEQTK